MESTKLNKILLVIGILGLGGAITNAGPLAQPIPYVIAVLFLAPYTASYFRSESETANAAEATVEK